MSENDPSRFHFTAAQLIEILQKLPPDLPVLVSGYESGYENFYYPEIIKLRQDPDNMYFDGQFQKAEESDTDVFDAIILQREFRDD